MKDIKSFLNALQRKHMIMGLGVLLVYLLLCLIVLLRTPKCAKPFVLNGLLAVLLSFCVIVWCSVKRCSSHIALSVSLLMIIGACTQSVISKEAQGKQAWVFIISALAGLAAILLWDRAILLLSRAETGKILIVVAVFSALLYIVLLMFGKNVNGAKAWVMIRGRTIQLTELSKLVAVFFFAYLFSEKEFGDRKKIAVSLGYYVSNAFFLAVINELGTLLVITFVLISMCFLFLESRKYAFLVVIAFIAVLGLGYVMIHEISRQAAAAAAMGREPGAVGAFAVRAANKLNDRFEIWLNLDRLDSYGIAYQSLKAKDAILVGGLFGSKLNVSIPYGGSDFIFPSLILRFGLAMGIMVFLQFYTIYYYGMAVCVKMKPSLSQSMCAGCTFCIVIQALLMIFGSTNFFIMTGIPVPFLSRGGTAQVIVFIMSALLLYFSEGTEGADEK